jgi:predicted nuclease of predicted toxin-antitoxin system
MDILVDENIPYMTGRALRQDGHDVHDIRSTPDKGATDVSIWGMAQREKRLLITTDKGFTSYRNERHCGILIVRLRQPNRRKIHERVMQAIIQFESTDWPNLLVIMRDTVQSVWKSAERK